MPEIKLDSEFGKQIGFVSDFFYDLSYLWEDEDMIVITVIESKYPEKGNFSRLLKAITEAGYYIEVPTPFPRMEEILTRKGFKKSEKFYSESGEILEYMTNRERI